MVDNASSGFADLASNADTAFSSVSSGADSASTSMDSMGNAADSAGSALNSVDGTPLDTISSAADSASTSLDSAGNAADSVGTATNTISSQAIDEASAAATSLGNNYDQVASAAENAAQKSDDIGQSTANAGQESAVGLGVATAAVGTLTAGLELAAQQMGKTEATFQKMANVNLPVAEVRNMISSLISATFPQEDALSYVRTLKQIGLTSEDSLSRGAAAFNTIQVATGVGSDSVIKFSNSMVAMGIDMNNIPSTFNAIAYANANMVGGFDTYVGWMQKYDSTFKGMGLTIDQTAVLVAGATKKFGGGRAAYTGLATAIKDSNGDLGKMEELLGMVPGSLQNASETTAAYGGKLDKNNQIMKDNTTLVQKAQAEISKLTTEYGGIISPIMSAGGAIGGFATTIGGLITMRAAMATASATSIMAQNAETGSIIANDAALNGNIFSRGAAKIASMASAVATGINASALEVETGVSATALGAAMAHTGATEVNTVATGLSTSSRIIGAASFIGLGVATGIATAAQWLLNIAMSMNPVMIVVIAIVALIAVLGYLYYNNETVRNAINALWSGMQALGSYIMGGLMAAWNALTTALSPITNALGKLWGAISKVFSAFASSQGSQASGTFNQIASAVSGLWKIISVLVSAVISGLIPVWNTLLPILIGVANFIGGFFSAVWTTLGGSIMAVLGFVASFINSLADLISGNITFSQFITQIWNGLMLMFTQVFLSIATGIGGFVLGLAQKGLAAGQALVTGFITMLMNLPMQIAFWLGFVTSKILLWGITLPIYARNAAVGLVNGFINFIKTLPGTLYTWLLSALSRISSFGSSASSYARNAGSQMVSGFISFIRNLPANAWSYLVSTLSRISSFGSSAGGYARSAGSQVLNGIKNAIASLPSVMWDEMMAMGQAILNVGGTLYNYAAGVGQQIVDGIKAGAGIKSPGDAYKAIKGELDIMGELMDTAKEALGTKATNIGTSITDGFKSNLSQPSVPIPTSTATSARPAAVTASSAAPTTIPNAGVNLDIPGLQAQTTAAQAIVATNVAAVTAQYNLLKTNTGSSWTAMVATQKTSLSSMQSSMGTTLTSMKSNMKTTLDNIVANNKSGYSTIQSNTQSTLSSLQTQTTNSMGNVKSSWNSMRDSLVSAADKIRSNAGGSISNLSGNIGIFYRKVSNPSLFLAGHAPDSARGSSKLPMGGFAGHSTNSNELDMLDMALPTPCNDIDGCYAGWSDLRPNTNDIIGKVDNYSTTFPPYGSFNKNVGDFTNSSMPIMGDLGAFTTIASNMIGKTSYQYYFNSKGGDPRSVYDSGGFNCYDGALIMLSLANAFGLGGYMQQGTWNGIGHAWAVIDGETFDTTAYQDGYGWTSPKVQGYTAPSAGFKSYDVGEMNPNYGNDNEPITIEGSLEHKLVIDLENVPNNIDQASLEQTLKGMIKDPEILKAIVKDDTFMNQLNIEIARKIAAYKRANGAS